MLVPLFKSTRKPMDSLLSEATVDTAFISSFILPRMCRIMPVRCQFSFSWPLTNCLIYVSENKAVGVMKPGHCFTIEPMISEGWTLMIASSFYLLLIVCYIEGVWKDEQWPDNWTAVTQDGKLSAQFEHTLLVTDTGVEVLTQRLKEDGKPYFITQH